MPGPPKQPRALKELKGTLQKHKENPNPLTPQAVTTLPAAPQDLPVKFQETWYRLTAQMQQLGYLTELDLEMLKAYFRQLSMMEEAWEILEREGKTIIMTNKGGGMYPIKSPWISIYNEALSHANRLAMQYGLTPSAREKLSANPKKEEQKDPWADL
jgi:P27 family predicted phage terminase small subunit